MDIAVCRRVEDTHPSWTGDRSECFICGKRIIVEEGGMNDEKLCIHCAIVKYPDLVLFVELPPDEFGNRSMAKGIQEVFAAKDGEWHKDGVWHNQKWILARQDL